MPKKKIEIVVPEVLWVKRNLLDYGNCYVGNKCSRELIKELRAFKITVKKVKSDNGWILVKANWWWLFGSSRNASIGVLVAIPK